MALTNICGSLFVIFLFQFHFYTWKFHGSDKVAEGVLVCLVVRWYVCWSTTIICQKVKKCMIWPCICICVWKGVGRRVPTHPQGYHNPVLFVLCTAPWAKSLGWTLGPCPAVFACIQCCVRTTSPKGFWRLWQFCFRTTGSGALGLLDCVYSH